MLTIAQNVLITTPEMNLSAYMKLRSLSNSAMAEILKCSVSATQKYRYGSRIPRPEMMRRIQEVTDGAVTPNDFLSVASAGRPVAAGERPASARTVGT